MKLGGLQKVTLIDYPDKVAATVFTVGCNFRCPYCHNPELVEPDYNNKQDFKKAENDFFKFLNKRKNLLDGVCITGGEPTLYPDLPDFIQKIKEEGLLVKLDSNGTNPEMLDYLIKKNLVDFIAMDVKAPEKKYNKATGVKVDIEKIKRSIELIKKSSKDYEFRITVVPEITKKEDIEDIAKWLKGSKKFVLQQFRPDKVLDPTFKEIKPYSDEELKKFLEILKPYIKEVELRI